MESHAEDLFLPDAWLGMKRCATHTTCPAHACACQRAHTQPQQRRCPPRRLVQYGHYVDSLEEQEAAPFCTDCATNRKILEHAWQVVANEFYDPYGRFNQAEWAARLQQTLEQHGGAPPPGILCSCARCGRTHPGRAHSGRKRRRRARRHAREQGRVVRGGAADDWWPGRSVQRVSRARRLPRRHPQAHQGRARLHVRDRSRCGLAAPPRSLPWPRRRARETPLRVQAWV